MIYFSICAIAFLFLSVLGVKAKRRADFYKSKPVQFPVRERALVLMKQQRRKRNQRIKPQQNHFVGPFESPLRKANDFMTDKTLGSVDYISRIEVKEVEPELILASEQPRFTMCQAVKDIIADVAKLNAEHQRKYLKWLDEQATKQEQKIVSRGLPLV